MMFSVAPFRTYLLVYLLAGAVSAVAVNLPRQQDPGNQVWPQTTAVSTTGIDPNTGQPYTTPITSDTPNTGTSTSTAGSPTSTVAVEPLDGEHTGDGKPNISRLLPEMNYKPYRNLLHSWFGRLRMEQHRGRPHSGCLVFALRLFPVRH